MSETGDLEFHEKDKSIPLSLVSAGVANMGMLALLIERGALDQRSFLFIDEPESNLHPAWQVEMAEFLFELARQGVHVVVSTHSMTILKWLEVHVKEKPQDRELVKLNKFPPDAEWNDDMDAVMAEVKQSLTKPFSDLYIQGLQQGQPKRRSHRGNRLGENDSRFQRKVRLPQRRRPKLNCFYDEVLNEHRLKLYGSVLVLCRLTGSREDVKAFLPEDEFQYWVVTTSTASTDFVLLDHLRDNLRNFLKSTLTREMMDVVEIIPSTELANKLSAQAIQID